MDLTVITSVFIYEDSVEYSYGIVYATIINCASRLYPPLNHHLFKLAVF